MKPEILVTCLHCKKANFTARGLRAHRCPNVLRDGMSMPLLKIEVDEAIADAEAAWKRAQAFPAGRDSVGPTNAQPCHGSTESRPTETKLELVTQADASTEKKTEQCLAGIQLALDGFNGGMDLVKCYMVVAGTYANLLMDIAPHGTGEKLLKLRFPALSRSRLHRFRQLAVKLAPALAKCPTIGLLKSPTLGKKGLPKKALMALKPLIEAEMKGETIMQYLSDKAPNTAGGFRPNAEMLAKWIAANCPEQKGKSYDDLTPEQKAAFKEQYVAPPISDEDAAELLREEVRANARDAAALMEDQKALVRLMDDMAEFGRIRMVYHDLNQMMLEMERKANIAAGDKRAAEWKAKKGTPHPGPLPAPRGEGEAKQGSTESHPTVDKEAA